MINTSTLCLTVVAVLVGCATQRVSEGPPFEPANGTSFASTGGEEPAQPRESGVAPRDPNDRTVMTRERCVLTGNCDREIARLAPSSLPTDVHRRADLLGQLCDAGNVRYCNEAALAGLHDRSVPINTAVARRRAALACAGTRSLADCLAQAAITSVAEQERRDRGLPPDPSDHVADSTIVLDHAPNGDIRAVTVATASSPPMPSERPFSEQQLSPYCHNAWTHCQANEATPCAVAATCFVNGAGAPLDQVRAANLYRRACDRGTAEACTELGIMMLQGEGIAADAVAARAIYEQGCSGGDPRGCSEAGLMMVNGEGGAVDRPRGISLLQRACTSGHTHACAALGMVQWQDAQTQDDRRRARMLVRDACQRGDASACTMLQRLDGGH